MQKWALIGMIFSFSWRLYGQQAEAHQYRSDSLFAAGRYAESLDERLKALSLLEKIGSCKQLSISYLQVGRAYYYLQNRPEARVWLRKSLTRARSCSFDSLIGINLRNLGALCIETNKPDSALWYLSEARQVLRRSNNLPEIASLFAMLFEVKLRGHKNIKQARRYLDSCMHYYKLVNDPNQTAFYCVKEGIYWQEVKHFEKAETYFAKAAKLYQSISSTEGYMYALTCLASAQFEAGKFKEAFQTQTRYVGIRDTVFKEQTARNMARYQAQFETQKKEFENLELKHENDRQLMSFGLAFIALVAGGFGIFKFRETAHRRRLDEQKREDQRIRFAEVVQAQEDERTRIAQDLHDGLGHLMAAIKLNTSALEVSGDQNRKILGNTESIIDRASKEVRQISHRLMPQSLSDLGLTESIRELAHRLNESGRIVVEIKTNGIIQVERPVAIAIYRIVQEVLNNALKHAKASLFTIQLTVVEEELILVLEDNGIGFDIENLAKTQGIGWQNIRSRVHLLKGSMRLDSTLGKGCKVEIQIPIGMG